MIIRFIKTFGLFQRSIVKLTAIVLYYESSNRVPKPKHLKKEEEAKHRQLMS